MLCLLCHEEPATANASLVHSAAKDHEKMRHASFLQVRAENIKDDLLVKLLNLVLHHLHWSSYTSY